MHAIVSRANCLPSLHKANDHRRRPPASLSQHAYSVEYRASASAALSVIEQLKREVAYS